MYVYKYPTCFENYEMLQHSLIMICSSTYRSKGKDYNRHTEVRDSHLHHAVTIQSKSGTGF